MEKKEINLLELYDLFDTKRDVYIYNDYEDIGYRCFYDSAIEKYRYIARKHGREFEVYKEDSNVLWDTMNQSLLITQEEYLKL